MPDAPGESIAGSGVVINGRAELVSIVLVDSSRGIVMVVEVLSDSNGTL